MDAHQRSIEELHSSHSPRGVGVYRSLQGVDTSMRIVRRNKSTTAGYSIRSNLNVIILLTVFMAFVGLHFIFATRRMNPLAINSVLRQGSSSLLYSKTTEMAAADRLGAPIPPPRERWITEEEQPFNMNQLAAQTTNLIIVAGHSVTMSGHLEDAEWDERDWFLLDYQKHRGLPQAILGHLRKGIDLANEDPGSLLILSGGETRAPTGPETEGASYYRVASAMKLFPPGSTVRARTITEEFATDSFENLMFSICRFREVTGRYPLKISVVSFTFKQRRFKTLHAPALRWPSNRFDYIGIDPPADTGFDLAESRRGEMENAAKLFETDPYGCHSTILQEKRRLRNPFFRTPPYSLSCPDMKELLRFCGPGLISAASVPWSIHN